MFRIQHFSFSLLCLSLSLHAYSSFASSGLRIRKLRPGIETDSHGCITSAGYTWCEPLQECIRPWETECDTDTASGDLNATITGNDIDSNGCIPSAGYSWCESLQECIRPWETECDTHSTGDYTTDVLQEIAMEIASELSAVSASDTTTAEMVKAVTERVISQQHDEDDATKAIMSHVLDASIELGQIHSDGENESIFSMVSELMKLAVGTISPIIVASSPPTDTSVILGMKNKITDTTDQVTDSISNVVNDIFNP